MRDETRLFELLERSRAVGEREGCLADAALEALADGSLPIAETAAASVHLRDCVGCLHAYASVRALLEPEAPVAQPALRRIVATRIPLGWAVVAAAAMVVVTWTLATTVGRERGLEGDAPRMVELSGQQGTQNLSGAVQAVDDASTTAVDAHVLEIAGEDGRRYTIFVWGSPTSHVGDRVSVEGNFGPVDESAGASALRGVAIRVRVDARR